MPSKLEIAGSNQGSFSYLENALSTCLYIYLRLDFCHNPVALQIPPPPSKFIIVTSKGDINSLVIRYRLLS